MTTLAAPDPPRSRPFGAFIAAVGATFLGFATTAGGMGILMGRVLRGLFPPRLDGTELWKNLYKMAFKSLPIVVLTALFTGAIMVIQAAPIVQRLGATGLLGWAAGFGTLREIAPLLTALMISGRVGANNAAELGTMVVTEQLDALRVLAIDPIAFLVLPRFIAITATLFMMTLFADLLALFGAAYTGQALVGVSPMTFYHGVTSSLLTFADVGLGLFKAVVFGFVIALASCYFGLATTGGAPGVGRQVNATVVASALGIFFLDYLVGFLLG
jgi:phospholipid/cholesterol/gamma-HCH transport system permease protein